MESNCPSIAEVFTCFGRCYKVLPELRVARLQILYNVEVALNLGVLFGWGFANSDTTLADGQYRFPFVGARLDFFKVEVRLAKIESSTIVIHETACSLVVDDRITV